jgi:hypothetical protein
MAKKKQQRFSLSLDDEIDFEMFGICSHHPDYRLAFGINEIMGWQLCKSEEEFVPNLKKGTPSRHSFYEYHNEEDMSSYYLVKNQAGPKYLFPEKDKIDYFLFIQEPYPIDDEIWSKKLNSIASVLAAYFFDPEELPSSKTIML